MAYIAYTVPLAMLYDTSDDIFLISKIHSSELINFRFWHFSPKKNNLQRQQKINYTINTATLGSSKCRNNGLFICSDGWDIPRKTICSKKMEKKQKKNFDLVLLKNLFFLIFYFSTGW